MSLRAIEQSNGGGENANGVCVDLRNPSDQVRNVRALHDM